MTGGASSWCSGSWKDVWDVGAGECHERSTICLICMYYCITSCQCWLSACVYAHTFLFKFYAYKKRLCPAFNDLETRKIYSKKSDQHFPPFVMFSLEKSLHLMMDRSAGKVIFAVRGKDGWDLLVVSTKFGCSFTSAGLLMVADICRDGEARGWHAGNDSVEYARTTDGTHCAISHLPGSRCN